MKVNLLEADRAPDKCVPKILVIMPAHNEEENILHVINDLGTVELPVPCDLLVINDGSTDRTGVILSENRISHISNIFNMGYGACLQVGYKYAVRHNYSYVIQMDADGQHAADNIRVIYESLVSEDSRGRRPDLVLGSRFMSGSTPFPVNGLKRFAFAWFRTLVRCVTGYREKIWDPTTGLQGLSRLAVKFYSIYGNFDSRFPDANMLTQMILLDFQIKQVPARMLPREGGKSMHTGLLRQAFYMMHVTLSILAVGIREHRTNVDRKMKQWLQERDTAEEVQRNTVNAGHHGGKNAGKY